MKGIPFEVCFFSKNGQKPCKINAFEKCVCNALGETCERKSEKGFEKRSRRRGEETLTKFAKKTLMKFVK